MHDSESDTFVLKNPRDQFKELFEKIGVKAEAEKIDTDEVEKGDYYSKYFSHSPAMVTNLGCLKIKDANIDVVQIIQKG